MKRETERLITFLQALDEANHYTTGILEYDSDKDECSLRDCNGILASMDKDNVVKLYEFKFDDASFSVWTELQRAFVYKRG